jgi:hypothetical protein
LPGRLLSSATCFVRSQFPAFLPFGPADKTAPAAGLQIPEVMAQVGRLAFERVEGALLELAHPLARDAHLAADLLERHRRAAVELVALDEQPAEPGLAG